MTHDPLAPTRTLARTPPTTFARDDDTLQSIEGARRAPVTRLSDRISFGGADDIDDTMMDILAHRTDDIGGFPDESFDFGEIQIEFPSPKS
jgi:hypothetical protein